jgi:hypothetical protein
MIRAGAVMCASIAVFAIPALGADAQFPPLEAYTTEGTAKNPAAVSYIVQRCGALSFMMNERLEGSKDSTDPKVKWAVAEVHAMASDFLEYAAAELAKSKNITPERALKDAGDSMLQLGDGYMIRLKASGNINGNWFTDDLVKSDYKFCRDLRAGIRARAK